MDAARFCFNRWKKHILKTSHDVQPFVQHAHIILMIALADAG